MRSNNYVDRPFQRARAYVITLISTLALLPAIALSAQTDQSKTGEQCVSSDQKCVQATSKTQTPRNRGVQSLQTVTVTARRRTEKLQNVPIKEVVLTPQILQENNIHGFASLQYVVPSLNIQMYAGQPTLTLRGQGGYDPASAPAVITYFNGVPIPGTSAGSSAGATISGSFYDLKTFRCYTVLRVRCSGRTQLEAQFYLQHTHPQTGSAATSRSVPVIIVTENSSSPSMYQ